MIDLSSLIRNTPAYKTIKNDKQTGRLSHAYLVLCADQANLGAYLTELAKMFFCNKEDTCGSCRSCLLISQGSYIDAVFIPREAQSAITSEDVVSLVQDSYIKPYEADKKVYVINNGQTMNAASQNKLLKTLEEPPKNVHIIIGATSDFALLPTVKSRTKKIEIPAFSHEVLINALKDDCPDGERLRNAVYCSDGTLGKTLALYGDEGLKVTMQTVKDVLLNMQSSKDVLEFSDKILKAKVDLSDFLSVFELFLRDLAVYKSNGENAVFNQEVVKQLKDAKGFTLGALVAILQDVVDARKRIEANSNKTNVMEWLLFKILEEKFKWQKL